MAKCEKCGREFEDYFMSPEMARIVGFDVNICFDCMVKEVNKKKGKFNPGKFNAFSVSIIPNLVGVFKDGKKEYEHSKGEEKGCQCNLN